MRSILCSVTILLSINGLIVHGASCKGGLSVRGYDRLDDLHRYSPSSSSSNSLFMTASCCDDEQGDIVTCHGGVVLQASDLPATATKAIDNQDDAHHTLTLNDEQRHKRSSDQRHQQCDAGCVMPATEIHCCPSNMSVFYPISALSAVTGERLHVVQAPPLILQPTIFARCLTENSPLLDAQCQQDFVPEMMFVAEHTNNESTNTDVMQILIRRQAILVENGCTCRFNSQPITLLDGPDVDNSLNRLLIQWSD